MFHFLIPHWPHSISEFLSELSGVFLELNPIETSDHDVTLWSRSRHIEGHGGVGVRDQDTYDGDFFLHWNLLLWESVKVFPLCSSGQLVVVVVVNGLTQEDRAHLLGPSIKVVGDLYYLRFKSYPKGDLHPCYLLTKPSPRESWQ